MSSSQSALAASLINQIACNNVACPNIMENEALRKKTLSLAKKLVLALERPQAVPLNSILVSSTHPVQSTVARISLDLELFDHLASGETDVHTVEDLSKRTNCSPILMARLLRVLHGMGWAEQVDAVSFKPTPISEAIRSRKPIKAGVKHYFDVALPIFSKLPEYFRTVGYVSPENEHDGPFQYTFNVQDSQTAFDWWSNDPVLSENFNTFMTGTGNARSHWVNWLPVQELLSKGEEESNSAILMVDIGGGKGHDIAAFLRKFPGTKGRFILEDLPNVIDDYDPKEGHERIECIKCDMRLEQPVKGAKIYHIHNVLHNWPDEVVTDLISKIALAMTPLHSRLLIVEHFLPEIDCSMRKAEMDWCMMAIHCGSQRTVSHFERICGNAGLKVKKFWSPPGDGEGVLEIFRDVVANGSVANGHHVLP